MLKTIPKCPKPFFAVVYLTGCVVGFGETEEAATEMAIREMTSLVTPEHLLQCRMVEITLQDVADAIGQLAECKKVSKNI